MFSKQPQTIQFQYIDANVFATFSVGHRLYFQAIVKNSLALMMSFFLAKILVFLLTLLL